MIFVINEHNMMSKMNSYHIYKYKIYNDAPNGNFTLPSIRKK